MDQSQGTGSETTIHPKAAWHCLSASRPCSTRLRPAPPCHRRRRKCQRTVQCDAPCELHLVFTRKGERKDDCRRERGECKVARSRRRVGASRADGGAFADGRKDAGAGRPGAAARLDVIGRNPAEGVRQLAVGRRKRRLREDELRHLGCLMREVAAEGEHPTGLSAIRLMLLTGFRQRPAGA
jgi:hypothetical protein